MKESRAQAQDGLSLSFSDFPALVLLFHFSSFTLYFPFSSSYPPFLQMEYVGHGIHGGTFFQRTLGVTSPPKQRQGFSCQASTLSLFALNVRTATETKEF